MMFQLVPEVLYGFQIRRFRRFPPFDAICFHPFLCSPTCMFKIIILVNPMMTLFDKWYEIICTGQRREGTVWRGKGCVMTCPEHSSLKGSVCPRGGLACSESGAVCPEIGPGVQERPAVCPDTRPRSHQNSTPVTVMELLTHLWHHCIQMVNILVASFNCYIFPKFQNSMILFINSSLVSGLTRRRRWCFNSCQRFLWVSNQAIQEIATI